LITGSRGLSLLALLLLPVVAEPQGRPRATPPQDQQEQRLQRATLALEADQKAAMAEALLAREEAASGRAFDPQYRADFKSRLASLPFAELAGIQARGSGLAPSESAASAGLLGDSSSDLVYTPVAPCRIVDTRLAGGLITANSTRALLVTGTGPGSQGGQAGGCGIPNGPATAAVVNFVAVSPTGQGNLRAWAFGATEPNASTINYAALGLNIANGVVVPLCDPAVSTCAFDLSVKASVSGTHLVADVLGYFRSFRKKQVIDGDTAYADFYVFTNVCGPAPGEKALELPITVTTASKIYAEGSGLYAPDGVGTALMTVVLRDQADTTTLATTATMGAWGPNPPDPSARPYGATSGFLRQGTSIGNPAFVAAPGNYLLQFRVETTNGLCQNVFPYLQPLGLTYFLIGV
jgi:hypothetical protein